MEVDIHTDDTVKNEKFVDGKCLRKPMWMGVLYMVEYHQFHLVHRRCHRARDVSRILIAIRSTM